MVRALVIAGLCALVLVIPVAGQAAAPADPALIRLMTEGRQALDRERIAEALNIFSEAVGRFGAAAMEAAEELQALERRLALEAAPEWLDPRGNQISAETSAAGGRGLLDPAVMLTYSAPTGKIVVPDLRIVFAFVRGSGSLTPASSTDAYGRASARLTRIDKPTEPVLLRASVGILAAGSSHDPAALWKEFTYQPVELRLAIMGVLVDPAGLEYSPGFSRAATGPLTGAGAVCIEHAPTNMADVAALLAGEPKALSGLHGVSRAAFLAIIRADLGPPEQLSYGGRAYNIFTMRSNVSISITRTADGRVLYTRILAESAGQGGSAAAARLDALRRVQDLIGEEMRRDEPTVRKALEAAQQ